LVALTVVLAFWLGPIVAGGALLASTINGFPSGWQFLRAVARGVTGAIAYAAVGGMLLSVAWTSGAVEAKNRDLLMWAVLLLASVVSVLSGFVEARWFKREGESPFWLWPNWRSFSLRRLFIVQFVLALALGWWLFTRRETFANLEFLRNLPRERRPSFELMPSEPRFD
jgi:hypothetical protein